MGISYGFLMRSKGFGFAFPVIISIFLLAGSMQFIAVNLLLGSFSPISALLLTLVVNAGHLFYGISMLDKFKNIGSIKPYLIFGMSDETFSINCTATPDRTVNKKWFMFFVTLLNHIYWVTGTAIGALCCVLPKRRYIFRISYFTGAYFHFLYCVIT